MDKDAAAYEVLFAGLCKLLRLLHPDDPVASKFLVVVPMTAALPTASVAIESPCKREPDYLRPEAFALIEMALIDGSTATDFVCGAAAPRHSKQALYAGLRVEKELAARRKRCSATCLRGTRGSIDLSEVPPAVHWGLDKSAV